MYFRGLVRPVEGRMIAGGVCRHCRFLWLEPYRRTPGMAAAFGRLVRLLRCALDADSLRILN